jgi:Plasmid recombination enzyme
MPLAIARIIKLKQGNISASAQHSRRQRETPNADPAKSNVCLIDADADVELEDLVRGRIGDQPIRKNAVLCVEMLLSASPEYFRPDNPAAAGDWETAKLEQFQYAVQQWLTESYGDRIVRADLHLDEATPHVHAYLVPLDDRGKLNCFGLFGDRAKLSRWQDSYAGAMATLGLARGIRGSRATYTQVKEYYAAVMQAPDLRLDGLTVQHQLADRARVLRKCDDLERTARSLEGENQRLQQQVQQLQAQVQRSQPTERQPASLAAVASRLGLGDQFDEATARAAIGEYTQALLAAAPVEAFIPPQADERQWLGMKRYLTQALGLPSGFIDRLHRQGLVYAGRDGKGVFLMRDLDDRSVRWALLYDREVGGYTIAAGSRSASYFYLGSGEQVVLVDSPVEAMSKWVLDQPEQAQGLYVSVSPLEDLPQVGRLAAGVRVLPQRESWNQDLQDALRVRLDRERQAQMGKGRSGLEMD